MGPGGLVLLLALLGPALLASAPACGACGGGGLEGCLARDFDVAPPDWGEGGSTGLAAVAVTARLSLVLGTGEGPVDASQLDLHPLVILNNTAICYEMNNILDAADSREALEDREMLEDGLEAIELKYRDFDELATFSKIIESSQLFKHIEERTEERKKRKEERMRQQLDNNNLIYMVRFVATTDSCSFLNKTLTLYVEDKTSGYSVNIVSVESTVEPTFSASIVHSINGLKTSPMYLPHPGTSGDSSEGDGCRASFPLAIPRNRGPLACRNTISYLYEEEHPGASNEEVNENSKIVTNGRVYRTYFSSGMGIDSVTSPGYIIEFTAHLSSRNSTSENSLVSVQAIPDDMSQGFQDIYEEEIPGSGLVKLMHCLASLEYQYLTVIPGKDVVIEMNFIDDIKYNNIKYSSEGVDVRDAVFKFSVTGDEDAQVQLRKELKQFALVEFVDENGSTTYELCDNKFTENDKREYEKLVRKIFGTLTAPLDADLQEYVRLNLSKGECGEEYGVPCSEYLKVIKTEGNNNPTYTVNMYGSQIFEKDYPDNSVCKYGSITIYVGTLDLTDPPYSDTVVAFGITTNQCVNRGAEIALSSFLGATAGAFALLLVAFAVVVARTPRAQGRGEDMLGCDSAASAAGPRD